MPIKIPKLSKISKIALFLLPIIIVISLSVWMNLTEEVYMNVTSTDGLWDLREFDFSDGQDYSLFGFVEMIRGALLDPAEFDSRADEVGYGLGTGLWRPRDWNVWDGLPRGEYNYATSRMTVLLPDDGWYTFSRISTRMNQRIFVNGRWMMDVGTVGQSPETSVTEIARISFTAYAQDGVIEIVQQVSNFVDTADMHGDWYVTRGGRGEAPRSDFVYLNTFIAGLFMTLFFLYILLFFLLHRQRVTLYFALFCLTWAARLWFRNPGHLTLHTGAFLGLSWDTEWRITYITIPVTVALIFAIINNLFPDILQKPFRYAAYAISTVTTLLFTFGPLQFIDHFLVRQQSFWLLPVLVISGVYVLVRFVWKLRRITLPQGIFLSGSTAFVILFMGEILFRLHLLGLPVPIFVGLWVSDNFTFPIFTLCMGIAVFLTVRAEVDAAKEASVALAAENVALEKLSQMKAHFWQDISHEMRAPLAVATLELDFAQSEIDKDDESMAPLLKSIDNARNHTLRFGRMLSAMTELAALNELSENRERVDFAKLLESSAEEFRIAIEKQGVKLRVELADGLPHVYVERDHFSRIITNLLTNSANHTKHGSVTLTADAEDAKYITVRVSDTGSGIPPEILSRIFERGVSGRKSTGYGLYICKTIVEAHGGTIDIESELGEGTVVTFTVPVYGGQESSHA